MAQSESHESVRITWLVVCLLLVWILAKWFFSFTVVGDMGQPTWAYRPVRDVPGESPYAVYRLVPHPQHIRGEKGE